MGMAARDHMGGSIFTARRPTADELLSALRSEVRRLQARLAEAERARAEAEANAARLRRNALLAREPSVPEGDEGRGYRCPNCLTPCDWPFEQNYCCHCGTRLDWRTRNDQEPDFDWKRGR